ncbi:MAG: hypothetical protein ABWW63_05245 [Glaciecola sp.]|jgi:hypothetical protein
MSKTITTITVLCALLLQVWAPMAGAWMDQDEMADCHNDAGMMVEMAEMTDTSTTHVMASVIDVAMDCCGSDCTCPTSACQSPTLLPNNHVTTLAVDNSFSLVSKPQSTLPSVITHLYRPPIFA